MGMKKDLLQLSRERTQSGCIQGGERAAFHVSAPVGWLNDPNGFSWYDNQVHLFFQHHPYDAQWGPMYWGHCVTQDFVRWTLLPEALAPDQPYENGCFSGSAVTYQGKHALIYTSQLDILQPDGSHVITQQQSLAIGDGIDYVKHEGNPVIRTEQLPPKASAADFRDPKVWEENGVFRMVVASSAADKSGQILLYESDDLICWRFISILAQSKHHLGKMWECPDFFALDGSHALLISPQEMKPMTGGFHGKSCTVAMIGQWDEAAKSFTCERLQPLDYGWDFYASQTMLMPDGRRIMVAWMQTWDNNVTPPEQTWTGMMIFPRELRIRDGRLYQLPVREIERYYTNRRFVRAVTDHKSRQLAFGRQLDFTICVKDAENAVFSLDVAAGEYHYTRLTYNAPARQLVIDRRHAGMVGDKFPVQTIPLLRTTGELKLRVLMDKYSMELFLNDGEQAVTVLIFTEEEAQDVVIRAPKPISYTFECYEIDLSQQEEN